MLALAVARAQLCVLQATMKQKKNSSSDFGTNSWLVVQNLQGADSFLGLPLSDNGVTEYFLLTHTPLLHRASFSVLVFLLSFFYVILLY